MSRIGHKSIGVAIEQMWNEDLLNLKNLERLYIGREVEHRVRAGESKVRAIEQLAQELGWYISPKQLPVCGFFGR